MFCSDPETARTDWGSGTKADLFSGCHQKTEFRPGDLLHVSDVKEESYFRVSSCEEAALEATFK